MGLPACLVSSAFPGLASDMSMSFISSFAGGINALVDGTRAGGVHGWQVEA